MPKYSYFLLSLFMLTMAPVFGQKKVLQTQFTEEKITLDGKFDEEAWKSAAVANYFIMLAPDNGKPIPHEKRTEVKVVYNNEAVYVAAMLYDNEPNKIMKELTTRDNFASADHFGVFFNGYNDGQQEFRFFVSAAGVQQDGIYTEANGEDFSWDAIWDSHVAITEYGWAVEMRIPYAALRFSTDVKQLWGLNFYREIRRYRHQYSWNFLDIKINNESTQAGILSGIENIKTPTRLFLIPYASQYLYANKTQKTHGEFKGGLDIKYGINDAFTLDAILIPDFGQTKFDNVELNLSAFEQQFAENRPFFTEGTDLFNKGGLLYTRRIGEANGVVEGTADEYIEEIPGNIKLINALKVSGRTKGGMGIGVLNAVTEKTSVNVINNTTGNSRLATYAPTTNYNVFVLDQRFNKNSSVSFVNTNVTRDGHYRDANVSALVFDLNTKKNTYNMNGSFKYNYINEYKDYDDKKGFNSNLYIAKSSGKYRYGLGGEYYSKEYDINDLGINNQTHYHSVYGNASYRILKPTKRYNSYLVFLNSNADFDNRTGRIQSANINLSFNSNDSKNDYYGYGINTRPLVVYDFYEPRSLNQTSFVAIPQNLGFWFYFSSNYNKRLVWEFNPAYTFVNEKDRVNYSVVFNTRYRFNDRLSLSYTISFLRQNKNVGWVDYEGMNTIFARRDRITYTNSILGKYSINNKMNLNLNVRHYWSYAVNHDFLTLQYDNGDLVENTTYNQNRDSNLNLWNLDLSYSWWFAPGSQISVLYRNKSVLGSREFSHQFEKNFKESIDNQNLDHVFSISVRYFIDYNSLKNGRFSKSFTKPTERVHF